MPFESWPIETSLFVGIWIYEAEELVFEQTQHMHTHTQMCDRLYGNFEHHVTVVCIRFDRHYSDECKFEAIIRFRRSFCFWIACRNSFAGVLWRSCCHDNRWSLSSLTTGGLFRLDTLLRKTSRWLKCMEQFD